MTVPQNRTYTNTNDVGRKFDGDDIADGALGADKLAPGTIPSASIAREWAVVANGLLANGQDDGTVYTAIPGKQYMLVALIADTSGGLLSSGDEDLVSVLSALGQPTIAHTITPTLGIISVKYVDVEALAGAALGAAAIQARATSGGFQDHVEVTLDWSDGAITALHDGGTDGTNGVYVVFER